MEIGLKALIGWRAFLLVLLYRFPYSEGHVSERKIGCFGVFIQNYWVTYHKRSLNVEENIQTKYINAFEKVICHYIKYLTQKTQCVSLFYFWNKWTAITNTNKVT